MLLEDNFFASINITVCSVEFCNAYLMKDKFAKACVIAIMQRRYEII